ncbi:MAG: quinol:cytochrome C oxidoreductase [Flavobacteriales bacterium]|nr:quinol:cytochrome C oxidoreductase [Flavobacteriales bacterium]
MYQVSGKIKMLSFGMMIAGVLLFAIGYALNHQSDSELESYIVNFMEENPELYSGEHVSSSHDNPEHQSHAEHIEHAKHQNHNRPWSAFYVSAYLFFGISTTALFFLSVQNAAQSGWSVVVSRVMEAVASFIPYGGILVLIVALGGVLHWNHLFHWMEDGITTVGSDNYDLLISLKEDFLNKPFFTARVIFYVVGFTFFLNYVKKGTRKLDEQSNDKNYWRMYKRSVIAIVFFGFFSMAYAWDFIMSLDPHWYSTLFGWYLMISHLVSAISCIILFAIYLKKAGYLPLFNDNHLHDLTKYMFGFSLLWTYLWYAQFMLYWYANIPEEAMYFLGRFDMYKDIFLPMLIPNFLLPLLVLVSSSMKRNFVVVPIMAVIIILGHWWDFFLAIMPGTVGPFWGIGAYEIGALLFVAGLFIFVVTKELSKMKLEPKGNPLFHESEIYEYPF